MSFEEQALPAFLPREAHAVPFGAGFRSELDKIPCRGTNAANDFRNDAVLTVL
jgi:hypothetical protein